MLSTTSADESDGEPTIGSRGARSRSFLPASRPALLLVIPLALLGGCEPAPDQAEARISVTDPAGRVVTLDRPAQRVVSMMPAVTEWVLALGAGDRLVARTDFDRQPGLDTLPSVGGGLTPSVEWIAARSPDLVVAWPDAPSRSLVARLEQLGVPVYTAPVEAIDEALTVATDLGTLLGREHAADSATAAIRAGLDSVRQAATGPAPGVLFLIGLDPLMAAGPDTFLDELVRTAGGRNVLADIGIRWPQLSLEEVVRRAPDVIVVGSAAVGDPAAILAGRPGWREVPAVRHGRVFAVDPDFVNRPGPRLDQAAALLAGLIRP